MFLMVLYFFFSEKWFLKQMVNSLAMEEVEGELISPKMSAREI